MTALAGYWSLDGQPDSEGPCHRMLKAQRIYAPDPGLVRADGSLAMGRRLSRLLPEDQFDTGPVVGATGRALLVADLRLDNREELAAALNLPAPAIRELADSGLLMRALEAWGEAAVDRLVGDFAFAFWDSQRRQLLMARDFLGQRPLHFHRARNFFAFASMPKGLHALADVPRAPDKDALAAFVALLPETGTDTFFEGIEKVPAGHILTVTAGGQSSRPFWNPARDRLMLKDSREYEEAIRAELDRAVDARLRGTDGTVATQLSGGLDSSAVTATAARVLGERGRLFAYTAVPRHGYPDAVRHRIADERALAASVAALYDNVTHILIPASGQSPLDRLDQYFGIFDRPTLNLCNGVWVSAILDDARSKGLKVMLTGDAGNMSISYDGMAALPQMLRSGRWLDFAMNAASLLRGGARLRTVGAQAIGPFLPGRLWQAISKVRGRASELTDYTAIHPDQVTTMQQRAADQGRDLSNRPRLDPHAMRIAALRRVDRGNYTKGYLGGWGIDVRDPTADRRLIELCLSIPPTQFLAGGVPRSLARRAFVDRLPIAVTGETRKGYQAADWHEALSNARTDASTEIERCSEIGQAREVLSFEKLRTLLANWPERDWHSDRVIRSYRLAFLRGTSAAHFVRKATGSNA